MALADEIALRPPAPLAAAAAAAAAPLDKRIKSARENWTCRRSRKDRCFLPRSVSFLSSARPALSPVAAEAERRRRREERTIVFRVEIDEISV